MKSITVPNDKKCPFCSLINPPEALRCDCGYDFSSGLMKQSYLKNQEDRVEIENRLASKLKGTAIIRMIGVSGIIIGSIVCILFLSQAYSENEIDILGNGGQLLLLLLFFGPVSLFIGAACLRSITRSEIHEWGLEKLSIGWFVFEFVRQVTIGLHHLSYFIGVIAVTVCGRALFKGEDIVQALIGIAGFVAAPFIFLWIAVRMDIFRQARTRYK